jgi:hypothetical protein
MIATGNHTDWQCHTSIRWVRDSDRILLVDTRNQHVFQLAGEEAALWGWFSSGLTGSAVVPLLAELTGLPPADADARCREVLAQWRECGLLADRESPDG